MASAAKSSRRIKPNKDPSVGDRQRKPCCDKLLDRIPGIVQMHGFCCENTEECSGSGRIERDWWTKMEASRTIFLSLHMSIVTGPGGGH